MATHYAALNRVSGVDGLIASSESAVVMMTIRRFAVSLFVVMVGCAPGYVFTQRGSTAVSSKAADCDFEVLAVIPNRPFEEIWDVGRR